MTSSLQNKVAIVTGAGRNIGRKIAHGLAADGAAIVVNGRSDRAALDAVVAEIQAAGGKAAAVIADVSTPEGVAALVQKTCELYGGVDIAVANASVRKQTPFDKLDYAEWREILSLTLDGAYLLARNTLASMTERGGGAFIGISGISHHIGFKERVHVNAAKSGLEGLIHGLAVDLADRNITANAVAPGVVATEALVAKIGRRNPPIPVPLGRLGEEEEIAAAVRFLAGPNARYITGQTIHVNGGGYFGG